MAQYGLSELGFLKKKLTDVFASINDKIQTDIGPVNTTPQAVFGQFLAIVSEGIADVWDLGEDIYLAHQPSSAEGVSLDYIGDLSNKKRLGPLPSTVRVDAGGDQGTIIPTSSIFVQANTGLRVISTSEGQISQSQAFKIKFKVGAVVDSSLYEVDIDATIFQFISGIGTTEDLILAGLAAVINVFQVEVNLVDKFVSVTSFEDESFSFQATVGTYVDRIWSKVECKATVNGDYTIQQYSITGIETPVAGLLEVTNLLPGIPGRFTETDSEYRLRRKANQASPRRASVPGIEASIIEFVPGVLSAYVVENDTAATVDGMPPNSLEILVEGGADQDIREEIWQTKAGGIQTVGNITGNVVDSQGISQQVKFSRPTLKYIHLDINLNLYSEEEFPAGGIAAIKDAIVAQAVDLKTGEDVIYQRFFKSIYSVPGVSGVNYFKLGVTELAGESVVSLVTGLTTAIASNRLISAGALFITNGVVASMVVLNTDTNTFAAIVSVISEDELELDATPFTFMGENFDIQQMGEINIPMAFRDRASFDQSRITVTTN